MFRKTSQSFIDRLNLFALLRLRTYLNKRENVIKESKPQKCYLRYFVKMYVTNSKRVLKTFHRFLILIEIKFSMSDTGSLDLTRKSWRVSIVPLLTEESDRQVSYN